MYTLKKVNSLAESKFVTDSKGRFEELCAGDGIAGAGNGFDCCRSAWNPWTAWSGFENHWSFGSGIFLVGGFDAAFPQWSFLPTQAQAVAHGDAVASAAAFVALASDARTVFGAQVYAPCANFSASTDPRCGTALQIRKTEALHCHLA